MSCDIYLVRHGQTYWNAERKMQGQINIPLNEEGIRQAGKAAETLRGISFDICYSSPLSRAHETAEIILKDQSVRIIDTPLLLEQSYGLQEGSSQTHFDDPTSPLCNYNRHPEIYKPDIGGETFEEVMARGAKVIEQILIPSEYLYKNILIAAHGAILCGVLNTIDGAPIPEFWDNLIPNCGVRKLRVKDGKIERVKAF